ncbi:DNA topoisomerase IB [Aquincola sp. MAHUQ-54]|uniref:DNA topoisomerase n=1 Tax=Aquincola agrisoli TaxID=3119538 RepID=A0AAW9QDE7_9BURK
MSPLPSPLVYVSDDMPGWRRVRRGRGFTVLDEAGHPVRDAGHLARIRSLAIPPAYQSVWICPRADGHLQATGRDARGRKQYRYHPLWQAQQGQSKFERLRAFGMALPALRRRVRRDLRQPGLTRTKVLAALVHLLDTTYLRIGNDEYTRQNGSFGLTTLRRRHATVRGGVLTLAFRGKSGVPQQVEVDDPRLVRIVRRCQALPGQSLFAYLDDAGEVRRVDSADVNGYLREVAGDDFSAKDFRTWHASALALERLLPCGQPVSARQARIVTREVISEVAAQMGHTVAVCRQSYVHGAVLQGFEQGCLAALCRAGRRAPSGLLAREGRLLALMAAQHRLPAPAARAPRRSA